MLDSLCREISRRYEVNETDIPVDFRDLALEFGKRIRLATADRPLLLFLDSLDQLSPGHGAHHLTWLPNVLPENVSLLVSTREEEVYQNLKARQICEERLGGLSRTEGEELLSLWLRSVRRTLQSAQMNEVLEKFEQSGCNPLYLKLAFEEARLWTAYQSQEELAIGVEGMIRENMIGRLKDESNHGEVLVSHALGYLAASRYGLAEDELVDLLSRDLQVYEWFFRQSYHLPADLVQQAIEYRRAHPADAAKGNGKPHPDEERAALAWLKQDRNPPEVVIEFLKEVLPKADGPRLPVVLWSRLFFDLQPYLTERMVDGSTLLDFYHRELGNVSNEVFLRDGKAQAFHEKLADYFHSKADPAGDGSWTGGHIHGLSELPFHLTEAGQWDELYHTLTDFSFLEHKVTEVGITRRQEKDGRVQINSDGVHQLQQDFERALEAAGGDAGAEDGRAPLILTARLAGDELTVNCPVCNRTSPIQKECLDTVMTCPQTGCAARLKINPFTVKVA